MNVSRKQKLAFDLLNDPQIVDVLFGGGAGGGKSITVTQWIVLQCRNYPGIRIGLGRKELKRLKSTTVFTLLHEAHPLLNVSDSEYQYKALDGVIEYINGSSIFLVDLAHAPSDPEYDRFGSLNLTHTVIEEGGEIQVKARDVFFSRKNRYLNDKYNLIGKSITTCNPSINFLKDQYYKPYEKQGKGDYQKWEYGEVEINGEKQTAYRAFVPSLAIDNPFVSPNYINSLRNLPPPERKRLLEGNWDFKSSEYMLYPSVLIDRSMTDTINTGEKYIGVDVADSGEDKTIMSLLEDGVIVEQKAVTVDVTQPIGEQIALAIIEYAQRNGIDDAQRIGVDVVGVGASTRDFLRSRGWYVKEFVAGASAYEIKEGKKVPTNFKNLRGQTIYQMSEAMNRGEIKIYSRLDTEMLEKLRDDLMAHEYSTEERVILVKSKKNIKEQLGRSPDNAESMYIAYWASKATLDPRRDSSRIKL